MLFGSKISGIQKEVHLLLTFFSQDGVTSFISKECQWRHYNLTVQREFNMVDAYCESVCLLIVNLSVCLSISQSVCLSTCIS